MGVTGSNSQKKKCASNRGVSYLRYGTFYSCDPGWLVAKKGVEGFLNLDKWSRQHLHGSMLITAVRLKKKKREMRCYTAALALCATLAAAAWGRPRRRRPWAQAFDRLQPNRTVPLANRWPRPPPPPPTPAQLEIINQKRKWVAGADAAYAKDAREHDGERERAAQA